MVVGTVGQTDNKTIYLGNAVSGEEGEGASFGDFLSLMKAAEEEADQVPLMRDRYVTKQAFGYYADSQCTNAYFKLANDAGIIEYNGITFVCNGSRNSIELGDCTNLNKCICVPLTEGGSLIVNRNNLNELGQALSMFTPEDVGNILRAIQQDRMAQAALYKIEEEKFHESSAVTSGL